MADRHVGPTREVGPRDQRELARQRRLADRQDLGDRVPDRAGEVRHELGASAHERAVVVGVGIVGAQDEPFQVVEVRVHPVGAGPFHDLASDLGPDRGVHEQAPEPLRSIVGHRPDEPTLVADDGPGQAQVAGEAERARDHPPGHEGDVDAARHGRPDRRPGVRTDDQVVADERAVDVERDQLDGQKGRRSRRPWHTQMMPDRRVPHLSGGSAHQGPAPLFRRGGFGPLAAARQGPAPRRTTSPAAPRGSVRRSRRPDRHRSPAGPRRRSPGPRAGARAAAR